MRVNSICALLFTILIGLTAFTDIAAADKICEGQVPPCPDGSAPFFAGNFCTCQRPKKCAPQNWSCSWQPLIGVWSGCACDTSNPPPPPPRNCSLQHCPSGLPAEPDGFGGCFCEPGILKPFGDPTPPNASRVPKRRAQ